MESDEEKRIRGRQVSWGQDTWCSRRPFDYQKNSHSGVPSGEKRFSGVMTSYLKLQVLLKASTPLEATVLHDNWDLERVFAQRE